MKLLSEGEARAHLAMTAPEEAAIAHAVAVSRSMSEGTNSAGGYGVPVAIDRRS